MEVWVNTNVFNLCVRPVFCPFRSHCRRCRAQLLCARISLVSGPRRPPRDTENALRPSKPHPRAHPQKSGVRGVCGQVRLPGLKQLH